MVYALFIMLYCLGANYIIAQPAEETETYQIVYNFATLHIKFKRKDVVSALYGVIYIFSGDGVLRELHLKQTRS